MNSNPLDLQTPFDLQNPIMSGWVVELVLAIMCGLSAKLAYHSLAQCWIQGKLEQVPRAQMWFGYVKHWTHKRVPVSTTFGLTAQVHPICLVESDQIVMPRSVVN